MIDTPDRATTAFPSACATGIGPRCAYRRRMRQLRYLRPGDDGNHVILETADGTEQFVLYVTVPLRDAIRVDLPKLTTGPSTETEDGISPREIQVRVRSGADPEALADAHGMTLERVLRFAGPVLEERVRVADTARRGRARRNTGDGQTVVLGEVVDAGFATNGIDPFTVRWDAYRRIDGQWVVTAKWATDDADEEQAAEWAFNLAARNSTPVDDNAAALLGERPLRRPVVAEPEPEPEPAQAGDDAPPLVAGVVAFPRLAPAPPVSEPDDVGPSAEDVFDQNALDHMADVEAAAPAAPEFTEQHLPLRLADTPAQPAAVDDVSSGGESAPGNTKPLPRLRNLGVAARDEEKTAARPKANQRPKVPAWDDIVLGVRRPTE